MSGAGELIIEGVVTTLNPDHEEGVLEDVNISPMGPLASEGMESLLLKPYTSSRTYRNLKRHGEGVFHITDDVELIARATIGKAETPLAATREITGRYLPLRTVSVSTFILSNWYSGVSSAFKDLTSQPTYFI